WRISLHTGAGREQRFLALFVSEDERMFGPTARAVWDTLIALPGGLGKATDELSGDGATKAFEVSGRAAEAYGATICEDLLPAHQVSIAREGKEGAHALAYRRRAIERLGLPQVRNYRLAKLADEEQNWTRELVAHEAALPDLTAVLMVRVAPMETLA